MIILTKNNFKLFDSVIYILNLLNFIYTLPNICTLYLK